MAASATPALSMTRAAMSSAEATQFYDLPS
jgi:hypothetical protein